MAYHTRPSNTTTIDRQLFAVYYKTTMTKLREVSRYLPRSGIESFSYFSRNTAADYENIKCVYL